MKDLPERQRLHHSAPSWVKEGSLYFVTACTLPRGANQLCRPKVGRSLVESAVFYHERERWWLSLFLLMPDHFHALMAVPGGQSLSETMRAWKSYQTKQHGILWQEGFFDHRLRSDESWTDKANYICLNPVRAGLVETAGDWPYVWPR